MNLMMTSPDILHPFCLFKDMIKYNLTADKLKVKHSVSEEYKKFFRDIVQYGVDISNSFVNLCEEYFSESQSLPNTMEYNEQRFNQFKKMHSKFSTIAQNFQVLLNDLLQIVNPEIFGLKYCEGVLFKTMLSTWQNRVKN